MRVSLALALVAVCSVPIATRSAGRSEAAVSRVQYSVACLDDDEATVFLLWSGGVVSPRRQFVDLSIYNNGWLPDTFIGGGPFGPTATSLNWDGLFPDTKHYIRINQQLANGAWAASSTYEIETPSC